MDNDNFGILIDISFGKWKSTNEFKSKKGLRKGDPLAPFSLVFWSGASNHMTNNVVKFINFTKYSRNLEFHIAEVTIYLS